jgi:hypothetical protein
LGLRSTVAHHQPPGQSLSAVQSKIVQYALASVGELPKHANPSAMSQTGFVPSPWLGTHEVPHSPGRVLSENVLGTHQLAGCPGPPCATGTVPSLQ